mgnify:CR=1 FL=1
MTSKPKSNGQTIFVTGVNGHIGNHIVSDLLANGYNVKGSVRDLKDETKTKHVLQHATDLGVDDRLELVEGDILDADNWAEKHAHFPVIARHLEQPAWPRDASQIDQAFY